MSERIFDGRRESRGSRSGPCEPSRLLWDEPELELSKGAGDAKFAYDVVSDTPSPYMCPCSSGDI